MCQALCLVLRPVTVFASHKSVRWEGLREGKPPAQGPQLICGRAGFHPSLALESFPNRLSHAPVGLPFPKLRRSWLSSVHTSPCFQTTTSRRYPHLSQIHSYFPLCDPHTTSFPAGAPLAPPCFSVSPWTVPRGWAPTKPGGSLRLLNKPQPCCTGRL